MHTLDRDAFEWDGEKAALNARKHRIRFAEAAGALADPHAVTRDDPDSNGELRHISLGMDLKGRILMTVFVIRGEKLRIISCRRATAAERQAYRRR